MKKKEWERLCGLRGKRKMELKKKEFLARRSTESEGTLRGPRGPKNYLRYPSICIYGIAYILALLFVEMLR